MSELPPGYLPPGYLPPGYLTSPSAPSAPTTTVTKVVSGDFGSAQPAAPATPQSALVTPHGYVPADYLPPVTPGGTASGHLSVASGDFASAQPTDPPPSLASVIVSLPALQAQITLLQQQVTTLGATLMAFQPGSQVDTIVALTATTTLAPTVNTVYKVTPAAATVITLPAATGTGRRLQFDFQALGGNAVTIALNGSDAYEGGASLPPIISGTSFTLRDLAVNVWAIE